jgi:hypothetical protein
MVIDSNLYTTAENESHHNPNHHHFFDSIGRKLNVKKSPIANLGIRSSWCEIIAAVLGRGSQEEVNQIEESWKVKKV